MLHRVRFTVRMTIILLIGFVLLQCSGVNRLREYDLRDQTATSVMAPAPRAQVFTDFYNMDEETDIVSTAINIGTSIAKGVEAHNAQKRLDSAMEQVDIPELIRAKTFAQCLDYLYLIEAPEKKEADFILMMKIKKYGIDAKSWFSDVEFKIEVEVRLIDNEAHREVWVRTIKEEEPITDYVFGLGSSANNVITAVALSELSEEEMATGFQNLAEYVSGRIAEKIQKDYMKAHSEK
jgi:hypothetical protein